VNTEWATFAVASFHNSSAQFFKPVWFSNFSKLSDSRVVSTTYKPILLIA